jgi:hypothetical protein
MNNVKYVGMDVHKDVIVIVVLNEAGHVESRAQVKTKADNFCDFFRGLSGRVEVVFEEGAQSAWLYQFPEDLDPRLELESQPAAQTCFQRRGPKRPTLRRGSGLRPGIDRAWDATGAGASLSGAQTSRHHTDALATQGEIRPSENHCQELSRDRAGKDLYTAPTV